MKKLISVFVLLVSLQFALPALAAEPCAVDVKVNGLVCDFCARALEKVFGKRDEVQNIAVDLDNGNVHVVMKEGKSMDDATLTKLITDAGYNVDSITRECGHE